MAKYVAMDLVKELRGRVCGHSDMSFAVRNGTRYTMKRCRVRSSEPSAEELAKWERFAQTIAAVDGMSAEEKATYAAAFKKQKRYKTLRGYIFAQEYAKLGQ